MDSSSSAPNSFAKKRKKSSFPSINKKPFSILDYDDILDPPQVDLTNRSSPVEGPLPRPFIPPPKSAYKSVMDTGGSLEQALLRASMYAHGYTILPVTSLVPAREYTAMPIDFHVPSRKDTAPRVPGSAKCRKTQPIESSSTPMLPVLSGSNNNLSVDLKSIQHVNLKSIVAIRPNELHRKHSGTTRVDDLPYIIVKLHRFDDQNRGPLVEYLERIDQLNWKQFESDNRTEWEYQWISPISIEDCLLFNLGTYGKLSKTKHLLILDLLDN